MNRLKFLAALIILLGNSLIAQEKIQTGIVTYYNIVNNPNGMSFTSTWKLYFDNNKSMYIKSKETKAMNIPKEEVRGGTTIRTEIKILKSKKPFFYFSDIDKKELVFRETVSQELYTIKDSIETILWELHDEFKKVGIYQCQKATALFRGREYTVWFTTEVPVSHGPWKLRGLPGLIVEATDQTNKFKYEIAKIELGVNPLMVEKKIVIPDDVKKIQPMSVYVDAIKNEYENTMARARASLPKGARIAEDHECDECPKRNNRTKELYN
ncbi:GLPGLI family protein [Aquimarina sp. MAR_2010_214]|uniref:GLPGLI family protein n=1 Tax=Aquimarina sp. MAR_2010_214 TaxID=1250026 RepID=UPI000CADF3B7|nr:GLPGLI family protein [Aquimarina sp. MAR_2010_214]PKV50363.1 GLPGLI family protein [Aquimarina sp. MAR_2010_214]